MELLAVIILAVFGMIFGVLYGFGHGASPHLLGYMALCFGFAIIIASVRPMVGYVRTRVVR